MNLQDKKLHRKRLKDEKLHRKRLRDEELKIPKIPHLRWLVEKRSKVQGTLLKLHGAIEDHENEGYKNNKSYRQIIGFMQGTGFALWRACFLIDEVENQDKIHEHELIFLKYLIEDNVIDYTRDKKSKLWTSHYYVNDAVGRLIYIGKTFKDMKPSKDVKDGSQNLRINRIKKDRKYLIYLSECYLGWRNDKKNNSSDKIPHSKIMWVNAINLLEVYVEFVSR